jgi:glyoxylase-like metal-dependent hydrolase (beta-lactamase superfamily II)
VGLIRDARHTSVTRDLPPGAKQRFWPPMSSTLISGKSDAALVDTFITVERAGVLADWVAASGKNLTTIYATHRHGDHFFGAVQSWNDFRAPALLRRRRRDSGSTDNVAEPIRRRMAKCTFSVGAKCVHPPP